MIELISKKQVIDILRVLVDKAEHDERYEAVFITEALYEAYSAVCGAEVIAFLTSNGVPNK